MTAVDLDKIRIADRARRDMGDLELLADSIREHGVLSPILLTPDLELICGERRVRAARMAGLDRIPAQISGKFEDAAKALMAERDENTCRKAMTPGELYAIGQRLEELERPKAAARQGARNDLRATSNSTEFEVSEERRTVSPTDTAVAEALGVSRATYGRIKTVTNAAKSDPNPDVRAAAQEAADAMETGEMTVSAAAAKVREARKPRNTEQPDSKLAMPQPPKYGPRRKHKQVLESMAASLGGLAILADEIKALDSSVDKEEAARLADDLSSGIRSLNRIKQLLKEV